jgi:hypothetical protein
MAGRNHTSNAQFEAALRQSNGILSRAAEILKIKRQSVWGRAQKPRWQKLIAEIEDHILDVGDSKILAAMNAADMTTVRWYMDRKGRKRGYGPPAPTTTVEGGAQAAAVAAEITGIDAEL